MSSVNEESSDIPFDTIISAIDNGENLLLHGPGGCGKSYCLKNITRHYVKKGKVVVCTSTTGISAINLSIPDVKISPSTLHSWAGIGLARESSKNLLKKVYKDPNSRKRWEKVELLILDEVSMLGAELFDKLDFIAKGIRKNEKPFGGIQVIFSGDFLQLPPVKDEWVFNSEVWDNLNLRPFIFETPKRYDDNVYFQLLLRIRKGNHTPEDEKKLKARTIAYKNYLEILQKDPTNINLIRPTFIYSKKRQVDGENDIELSKLPGDTREFVAIDSFVPHNSSAKWEHYAGNLEDSIPKILFLKEGAQVMLKFNIDVKGGLANGTRGVITKIDCEDITVRFINGKKLPIKKMLWVIEDKNGTASREQFPFILAWAITVHKSQSCTLDYAICDLGSDIFCEGQAYVALSRVRNFRGLFISDFYSPSIRVNQCALNYSSQLDDKYNTTPK